MLFFSRRDRIGADPSTGVPCTTRDTLHPVSFSNAAQVLFRSIAVETLSPCTVPHSSTTISPTSSAAVTVMPPFAAASSPVALVSCRAISGTSARVNDLPSQRTMLFFSRRDKIGADPSTGVPCTTRDTFRPVSFSNAAQVLFRSIAVETLSPCTVPHSSTTISPTSSAAVTVMPPFTAASFTWRLYIHSQLFSRKKSASGVGRLYNHSQLFSRRKSASAVGASPLALGRGGSAPTSG